MRMGQKSSRTSEVDLSMVCANESLYNSQSVNIIFKLSREMIVTWKLHFLSRPVVCGLVSGKQFYTTGHSEPPTVTTSIYPHIMKRLIQAYPSARSGNL